MEPETEIIIQNNVDGKYVKGFDTTVEQSVFSKGHKFDLNNGKIPDPAKLSIINQVLEDVTYKPKGSIEEEPVFTILEGSKEDLEVLKATILGEEVPQKEKDDKPPDDLKALEVETEDVAAEDASKKAPTAKKTGSKKGRRSGKQAVSNE